MTQRAISLNLATTRQVWGFAEAVDEMRQRLQPVLQGVKPRVAAVSGHSTG